MRLAVADEDAKGDVDVAGTIGEVVWLRTRCGAR